MRHRFTKAGQEIARIPVRISSRIIELFSEGLYSSATKAIEELVANSFDAGAKHVHVLMAPDLTAPDATIIVVDDGQSMNQEGLRQHWLIGVSNKRDLMNPPLGRKQIGKFGIGKLATFVLANSFTHICKKDGRYFAATMDYNQIPHGKSSDIGQAESMELPLRELSEEEARDSLPVSLKGKTTGHLAIPLFGPNAAETWTVALLSDLKGMARELKKGRLQWVLRTAMPLHPDFNLFLNGNPVPSAKLDIPLEKEWVLGKDMVTLKDPAPDDIEPSYLPIAGPDHEFGLWQPQLGRITGIVQLYKDSIDEGKAEDWGRSNGFFIYVHGRLLNSGEDPNFGIPPNVLRHGTMKRFRATVHIDRLDEELRSSRESIRDAQLTEIFRNTLRAIFNVVRNYDDDIARQQDPNQRIANKIRQAPGSLTSTPLVQLVDAAVKGDASPKLLSYPKDLPKKQAQAFVRGVEDRARSEHGLLVNIETNDLPRDKGVAVFDVESGTLEKNANHPIIATFSDDPLTRDLVSLVSMAEVLTEAYLYTTGLRDEQVREIMGKRDELLRSFARSSLRRSAYLLAQDLIDSSTDQNRLEREVVAAFDMLGFEAEHLGGSGRPDGRAKASIGRNRYVVSLEAKSKEHPDGTVSSNAVGISGVARHRDEYECNHAVVIAPGFATSNDSAVVREARADKERCKDEGKTITLMRIHDLARLVRLVSLRPTGLDRLRSLFVECVSPDEVSEWIDRLEQEPKPEQVSYREILEAIWFLQANTPDVAIEFAAVVTYLTFNMKRPISKEELMDVCRAMQRIVPEGVVLREQSVELRMRPDRILSVAGANLKQYPEEQQKLSTW